MKLLQLTCPTRTMIMKIQKRKKMIFARNLQGISLHKKLVLQK
uniref:Uncharacterized protein n=1 Tax=Arundo donax TaxID=35708 RepID=A0A0A9EJ27_ARUDO